MIQYRDLKWEMKGQIRVFLEIWKAKDKGIRYLMGKTPNIFLFLSIKPNVHG